MTMDPEPHPAEDTNPTSASGLLHLSHLRPGVCLAFEYYLRSLPQIESVAVNPYLRLAAWRSSATESAAEDIGKALEHFTGISADTNTGPPSTKPSRAWLPPLALCLLCYALLGGYLVTEKEMFFYAAGTLSIVSTLALGRGVLIRTWVASRLRILHEDTLLAVALVLALAAIPLSWLGMMAAEAIAWGPLILLLHAITQGIGNTSRRSAEAALRADAAKPEDQLAALKLQELPEQFARTLPAAALALAAIVFCAWLLLAPHDRVAAALGSTMAVLLLCSAEPLLLSLPATAAWGTASAAARGIRWKNTGVLEQLWQVGIIVFSKSGVLTEGQPRVAAVYPAPGWTQEAVVRLAAALETTSAHGCAIAIRNEAARLHLAVPGLDEDPAQVAQGMTGIIDGRRLHVGSLAWVEHAKVDCSVLADDAARVQTEGKTAVIVAREGAVIGVIAVSDRLKRDSVLALRILRRMGIHPAILTGDSAGTARTVAEQLGIDIAHGDAGPAVREKVLKRMAEETIGTVAVVRRSADTRLEVLPIVMDSTNPPDQGVALEATGVTAIVDSIQMARAIRRRALYGHGLAGTVLLIGMPLASLHLLHPGPAVALASLAQWAVLLNAAQIRRFDPQTAAAALLRKREMLERI
jgi:cation transport ATPase